MSLNHKYELLFGEPLNFYSGGNPSPVAPVPESEIVDALDAVNPNDPRGLKLTEHRITFRISKSKDKTNDGNLVIYNISDNVREYLSQRQGREVAVVLNLGYEDEPLITCLTGSIVSFNEEFEGVNRVTKIKYKDGYTNIKEAYTVRSFRGGQKVSDIAKEVLKDLKLPEGTIIIPNDLDVIIEKPKSYSGYTKDIIDNLLEGSGLKFYVNNSTANITPEIPTRGAKSIIKVSANNGNLIGSPTVMDNTAGVPQKAQGTRSSLKIKTLLNGAFDIDEDVLLESRFHNGIYKIQSVDFVGDSEGTDWYAEMEIKPIDDWEVLR